ncbi:hypothetical protein [Azonexus sp.]|nr:hypothetical protein [Azonexus sp.]
MVDGWQDGEGLFAGKENISGMAHGSSGAKKNEFFAVDRKNEANSGHLK